MFMPNISFQNNKSESSSESETSLDNEIINSSLTEKETKSHGYNVSGELLWRHKFGKDGRTLSSMFKGSLSDNSSKSNQNITLNDELDRKSVV